MNRAFLFAAQAIVLAPIFIYADQEEELVSSTQEEELVSSSSAPLSNVFLSDVYFDSNHSSNSKPESKPETKGYYLGGFGGFGNVRISNLQNGAALSTGPSGPYDPESINVYATGKSPSHYFGMGGLHFGCESQRRKDKDVRLVTAAEVEAYYYQHTDNAFSTNTAELDPAIDFHYFDLIIPTKNLGYTANLVIALENKYLTPYIGGGFGQQVIWVKNANSEQLEPVDDPIDANHFNGQTNAHTWVGAVVFKGGLRKTFNTHYRLFAEYRGYWTSQANFLLGPTKYPTHRDTTKWLLQFDYTIYNMGVFGIDFIW